MKANTEDPMCKPFVVDCTEYLIKFSSNEESIPRYSTENGLGQYRLYKSNFFNYSNITGHIMHKHLTSIFHNDNHNNPGVNFCHYWQSTRHILLSDCWSCYPGNLSYYQVSVVHLKIEIEHPYMKATATGSPMHDGNIKLKYFPRYWPAMRGSHRSPVDSPHKKQWHRALMFSLICAWTNGWANNRNAGVWRRHRLHYDVTVMDLTKDRVPE